MKKNSRKSFHVFVNFIRTVAFATLILGFVAVLFREKLIQIPNIYTIFISLIILAGIISGIIASFTYSSKKEKRIKKSKEIFERNLEKLNTGEFAEVIPLRNIYEKSKSEIEDYLLENAHFYAVLSKDYIKCIMVYQAKNGDIKSAKQKIFEPKAFFDYFTFSSEKAPESMQELQVKLQ